MTAVVTNLPTQGSFTGHVSDIGLGRFKTADSIPDLAYVYQDPSGYTCCFQTSYGYGSYYSDVGNTVATLEGLGNGAFGTANLKTGTDIFELFSAAGVAVGDFDGDNRSDLHVTDTSNDQSWLGVAPSMGVYALTDSSGIFGDWTPLRQSGGQSIQYTETLGPRAGDITGDGEADIVQSSGTNWIDGSTTSMWYGLPSLTSFASSGDGTFSELPLYNPGSMSFRYTTIFDGNFDLALDVAVTGGDVGSFDKIDVLRGDASGLDFVTQLTASVGSANLGRIAAGDVNGDGKPDLVACMSFFADSWIKSYYGTTYPNDRGDGSTKGVVFFLNSSN